MYNKEALRSLLTQEEFKVIKDDGSILPPSNQVYEKISDAMASKDSPMTAKHVYTTIKSNRNSFYDLLLETFLPNANLLRDESHLHKTESDFNICYTEQIRESRKFRLILSAEKWSEIKPASQETAERFHLRCGKWCDVLAEAIYEQQKITCAFSFKSAKVYKGSSAKYYVKFTGKCNECNAEIEGHILNEPQEGKDVFFECEALNIQNNFPHSKRRQLRGDRRQAIARELVERRKNAAAWRSEKAKSDMDLGDELPPTLPNANVLRKAKQEENDNRLGFRSSDPIVNLRSAKANTNNGIRGIGLEPFYCMYWSVDQIALNNDMIENDSDTSWLFDGTGGVCYRMPSSDVNKVVNNRVEYKKSKYIFLYQIVTVSETVSCPTFQTISSRHDATFLTFFIEDILRSGAKKPKLVITDFGKALLIAVAKSVARCKDLKHYLQLCHQCIVLNSENELPDCCLRIDVCHFINIIARWKCLKNQSKKIRQFFLRAIAHVYQMADFDQIEKVLLSILVVALSEHVGFDENLKAYSSNEHLHRVNSIIKGSHEVADHADENNDSEDEEDDEYGDLGGRGSVTEQTVCTSKSWIEWANNLFGKAELIAEKTCSESIININMYNIPSAAKSLKELMYYLPLWTNTMNHYFPITSKVRSSSAVEGHFSKIKSGVFETLPVRPDKFPVIHMNYLNGEIKLAGAKLSTIRKISVNNNKDNCKKCSNEDEDFRNIEENWKGKNPQTKQQTEVILEDSESSEYEVESEEQTDVTQDIECKSETTKTIGLPNYASHEINANSTATNEIKHIAGAKCTYLNNFPEWDSVGGKKTVHLPNIQNGSLRSEMKIKGKRCAISNTCPFDALLNLIMHGCLLSQRFKDIIRSSNFPLGNLALEIIKNGTLKATHYKSRFEILKDIAIIEKTITSPSLMCLNANTNASHLAEYLLSHVPCCISETVCACCKNYNKRSTVFASVNIDILLDIGYDHMEEAIIDVLTNNQTRCSVCQQQAEIKKKFEPYILIDTSVMSDNRYKTQKSDSKILHLNSIKKQITVQDCSYNIAGIVHYISLSDSVNDGHYVAFVFNGLHWSKYDDLHNKIQPADDRQNVCPHILMYVAA